MKPFLYSLLLTASLLSTDAKSQLYHRVIYTGGTQNIGGNSVTVTPAGCTAYFNDTCGGAPYWIGFDGRGVSCTGSFTYQFAAPVRSIRAILTYVNDNETVSFSVNGSPYLLSSAELRDFPGSCRQVPVTIQNGAVFCPPGTASVRGTGAGGQVDIRVPAGISSITITGNGIPGMNGVSYSFLFGGAEATNPGAVCPGDTLRLFAGPTVAGATYSWTGPGGFTSSDQNPVIPAAQQTHAGIYRLTVSSAGDTATDTTIVTLLPAPVARIGHNMPLCAGSRLLLEALNSDLQNSFRWYGPGGFTSSLQNPSIPQAGSQHNGAYYLEVTGVNGCTSYDTEYVEVLSPVTTSGTAVFCDNEGYPFQGKRLFEAGSYTATFTGSNGCDSVSNIYLISLPAPEVTVIAEHDAPFCLGDTLLLRGAGASSYRWDGNIQMSELQGAEQMVRLRGRNNQVMLIGTAANECRDTAFLQIPAENCCWLYAPNAFSPNGDGRNDRFGAISRNGFRHFSLTIYNRWGERVFSGFDQNNTWDGTFRGLPAETGTYYYHISATCPGGEEQQRQGDLTLIR